MIELAPFECRRKLADGTIERAFFWAESGVLAWLDEEPAAEIVTVYLEGRRVEHESLLAAYRAFAPQAAEYDLRDAQTLAAR